MRKKITSKYRIKTVKEESGIELDRINYKDYEYLSVFLTDRGRIKGREKTGLSSKHQRLLTREIKRARHLGLLPFVSSI